MLARTSWYTDSEFVKKTKWRNLVTDGWSGDRLVKYSLPGYKYTSIMQVPSSKDGRLFRMLAKSEPRLT